MNGKQKKELYKKIIYKRQEQSFWLRQCQEVIQLDSGL